MPERAAPGRFPFTLPFLAGGDFRLDFAQAITFLVGENGTGKSTLLEAIAAHCGFNPQGGGSTHYFSREREDGEEPPPERVLAGALRLSWKPKVTNGLFFRAESFFNLATYLDEVGSRRYGARELHALSHGEAFFGFLQNRLSEHERNIVLLDEPEAALSPTRQMAFLALLHRWHRAGTVQAIIATHAPMLMAYPEATILSLDGGAIQPVALRETNHFRSFKSFLEAPERYLRRLLDEAEDAERDGQDELPLKEE
jgi:predicted ATPase